MKRVTVIVVVVMLAAIFMLTLIGCTPEIVPMVSGDNLMDGASVISSSSHITSPNKSIDNSKSSSAVLNKPMHGYIDYDLGSDKQFDTLVLREKTDNVNMFRVYIKGDGENEWMMVYEQDRITDYRMCYLEQQNARYIRLDFTQVRGTVKIADVVLYNNTTAASDGFRVTQYLVMMDKDTTSGVMKFSMDDVVDDEGFSGNYNVVTDVMIINGIGIGKDAMVHYGAYSEEEFTYNLATLREIIGSRNVKIRLTMFINPYKDNKQDSDFIKANMKAISDNVGAFAAKHNLDGIDYDWEYPQNMGQWKVYSDLIVNTAKHTKVTVALPTWGIGLNRAAREAIEFVNLMTYDIFDARGDHSNIYMGGVDGVSRLLAVGFKREQICLGIPTYARTVDRSGDAWPTFIDYPELGKWGNIVHDFPYVEATEDGGTVDIFNTAYFNGYAMTRDKTALAMAMQLGGVMLFRARCDAPYTYEFSCHRAVEDVINNYK